MQKKSLEIKELIKKEEKTFAENKHKKNSCHPLFF